MSEVFGRAGESLELLRLDVSWARRAADFDAQIFGEAAWSFFAWQGALSSPTNCFYAYVRPAEGMQARGDIVALGGVSSGYEPEILTLGVSPAWRGQGLGGKLLDVLIAHAEQDERAETIFLEVRTGNEAALRLYQSRGFEPCGSRPRYYGHSDALILRRPCSRESQ